MVVIATVNTTVCWIGVDGDTVNVNGGNATDASESSDPTVATLSTSVMLVELSRSRKSRPVHAASQLVTCRFTVTVSPGSMMPSPSVVVNVLLVTEIAGVFLVNACWALMRP